MTECYIYDHVRTPRGRGKKDGSLYEVTALELGATVLRAIRDRNDMDTSLVDDVVFGCVDPVGEAGGDITRAAVLAAKYDESVSGIQINRFCASGLDATNIAASQIMAGMHDISIGGGVEGMSRLGIFSSGGAWPIDPSIALPSYFVPQGISADLIATKYGFSRDDCDSLAVQSQQRAKAAWDAGYFDKSIAPVVDINGLTILDHDEHMRPTTTVEQLGGLKPSFIQPGEMGGFNAVATQRYPEIETINHIHHAGNSSGIVDGAAAILMGTKEAGEKLALKPRAKIRAFANIGTEPCIMLTGPASAAEKALKNADMTVKDIDLWEINEAFASVVLHAVERLGISHEIVNVNGGAIAMGHPLGATGAMLVGIVLDELERRNLNTALITLCIGAGMGTATIIERV